MNGGAKKALFLYVLPQSTSYQIESSNDYSLQLRPKLGFLYLASTLKARKGIKSDIWDQTITRYTVKEVISAIASGEYLFAGFYCADSMEGGVVNYIESIRRDSPITIPIVVGGPSFPHAERFLRAGCDIVCNGEGEDTICEIADFLKGSGSIEDLKGISYLRGGKVVTAQPQKLIEDIDTIPLPDYSIVDFNKYCDYYIFTMRKPYTTMITSRGCPFDCIFCDSHALWGRRYRVRSVGNVMAEIDELVERHKIRYIAFQDDVFGMDHDWAEEICAKLTERKYDLKWMCILHPFSFKKDQRGMLAKLKRAGCDLITMGLQSAHPEILKRLNRHSDEPQYAENLVRSARGLDMLSLVSFIFGSPGETRETVQASIDFAMRTKPNYAKFYSMEILAGSRLAKEYGLGAKLCELDKDEIKELCRFATQKFYTNPGNFARNISFVLRKNPAWLAVGFKHAMNIMDSMGIRTKKEGYKAT